MPKPFIELAEEFNATAKAYLQDDVSIELLTTKYSVLMGHKTADVDERRKLTETLFDCGLKWLQTFAGAGKSIDHSTTVEMLTLFSRLTDDDSINLIPAAAPAQLSDAALDLLRRAEGSNGGSASTKTYLVKLAGHTLEAADKIKAAQDAASDVSTSKDITPSKKIELKKDGLSL